MYELNNKVPLLTDTIVAVTVAGRQAQTSHLIVAAATAAATSAYRCRLPWPWSVGLPFQATVGEGNWVPFASVSRTSQRLLAGLIAIKRIGN